MYNVMSLTCAHIKPRHVIQIMFAYDEVHQLEIVLYASMVIRHESLQHLAGLQNYQVAS